MDLKEEYKNTVEKVKTLSMTKGQRLTNADIAQSVGLERETLQNLLSPRGKVLKKHLEVLKLAYQELLQNSTTGSIKNPDRDYRDSYLSALEREIGYLKEKLEVNLAEMEERQKAVAAMVRVALMNLEKTRSIQEKVSVDRISVENNRLIAELLEKN